MSDTANTGLRGKCHKCKDVLKEKDHKLQCEDCLGSFHIGCDGVSVPDYKVLSKTRYNYFCTQCSPTVKDSLQKMKILLEENKTIKHDMQVIQQRLSKVENRKELIAEIKREVMLELVDNDEKAKRKNNLVIYNMKEEGEGRNENNRTDVESCEILFRDEIRIQNYEIKEVVRLGTKTEDRKRPLLVKFASPYEKYNILKNAHLLRHSEDIDVKNTFISNDLTPKERDVITKLRTELKRLREEENDDSYYLNYKLKELSKKNPRIQTNQNPPNQQNNE